MGDLAEIATQHWHLGVVGLLILSVSLNFLLSFVPRARGLSRELKESLAALRDLREQVNGHLVELDEVTSQAMSGPALSHLWLEYAKTLHPQRGGADPSQTRIVRWRATALAETFFTDQAVVDTRLRTEFYKHLPGILTGLGIIGTFSGLIIGLRQFNVSSDPATAQAQLGKLVNSVGQAFIVSAVAISLAMLFTWIEKALVASRYQQIQEIRELIDSLFEVGAGEEYLERLVVASETSATQSAHIKDALVADLKEILTSLAVQQIEAQSRSTGQISGDVGKAITDNLGAPMRAISEAVLGVSASQGEAVNRMLTDVLASFSAQMREMFGGQIEGISSLLRQTSDSMAITAARFSQLAINIEAAGTGTVDAMGERLNRTIDALEARQQFMNTQMGAFVEQIHSLVAESQSESGKKLHEALSSVGERVAGIVAELHRQAETSAETQGHRQERFEKSTGEAIGSLSSQVASLLSQSVDTNKVLQSSVAHLATATDNAIADMNSGAEILLRAAGDFAKAGQGVSDTMRSSSIAVDAIKSAASQLSVASDRSRDIFKDYERASHTFSTMVSELKLTVENAKREASMTSELVEHLGAATTQLVLAQEQSEDYLKGVSEVLTKAHESFAENIERTLRESNRQFQGELSSAVQLLSGAIKNLGDVVDDIPVRR